MNTNYSLPLLLAFCLFLSCTKDPISSVNKNVDKKFFPNAILTLDRGNSKSDIALKNIKISNRIYSADESIKSAYMNITIEYLYSDKGKDFYSVTYLLKEEGKSHSFELSYGGKSWLKQLSDKVILYIQ